MKQFFLLSLLVLASCNPKIHTEILRQKPALDKNAEIRVYQITEGIPEGSEKLATFSIVDYGTASKCRYDENIKRAKDIARNTGGNAIKLTRIIKHSLQSNCDQLFGEIYDVPDFSKAPVEDNYTLKGKDYALIHIYRPSGLGPIVGYKIRINDTIVAKTRNNWKRNICISKKHGSYITMRSATEKETKLEFKVENGHEYYVRAGLSMGVFVGQPTLELVDYNLGKKEFEAIDDKNLDNKDKLYLKDGRIVEGAIYKETGDKYLIVLKIKETKVKTGIDKNKVEKVERDCYEVKK